MAVDALELRPRNAIALFDASLRLCVSTTGVWALTLPAGALVVAALFNLVEAITRNHDLLMPVTLWTGAWLARGVAQGAACHYVGEQVLGTNAPSVRRSALAALKRAPSLIIASAWVAVLNAIMGCLTLGVGFLFVGAHAVAYAAVMRGQGSVVGLYGTCSTLLGPTRHIAPWVRVCGLSQLFVGVNLHIAVASFLSLTHSLLGFDVAFADHFASMTNPMWIATITALTFALFEPVRAATATLMLIDGRVRQEGLDLVAQVEQLPRRTRPRSAPLVATLAVMLLSSSAFADSALADRVREVSRRCRMHVDLTPITKREVSSEEQSSLSRFIGRVERQAYENEDCDSAEASLREGLRLVAEVKPAKEGDDPGARVQEILRRSEFENVVERTKDDGTPEDPQAPDEPGWFAKLLKKFLDWLAELLKRKPDERRDEPINVSTGGADMAGANVVMIAALVLVAAALIFILVRSLKKKDEATTELDSSGGIVQRSLEADPMSALSKPAETWAGLADELAARGNYREAIRHLYLALLSRLHRDGVIDYDPTHSNWEYLFAFKGSSSVKAGFRELTQRFDFAWYGNLGVDALAWGLFRRTAEPLLAPPVEGANAHG